MIIITFYKVDQHYIHQTIDVDLMNNCIEKFTRAPIEYINDLRALQSGSITMKGTAFYPAFPVSLLFSLLSLCSLAGYMIYYFIEVDESVCYAHITYGIITLAVIYPIEAIIIYICMFGSVALSKTNCWKVFSIIFFGIIVTGFSFGGLGFAFLCTISKIHPLLIPSDFLSSNTFIQVIVYGYLAFFALYLILVPILTISYNERSKNPNPDGSACDTFCCVIYYIFQFLFMCTALFMICIKLLGPPLFIYVLIQVARAGFKNSVTDLGAFFALGILSVFLPICSFTVVYLISNLACSTSKEENNQQKPLEQKTTQPEQKKVVSSHEVHQGRVSKRKSIFMMADDSKTFGDEDNDTSGIRNDML